MSDDKANVLLVDDEPANLLAFKSALKDLDANIVCAGSGEEALKHLLDEDFAVILMDVRMPRMDGLETASYIRNRERSENTPLIFITATSSDETKMFSGYKLGAVDFLYKPIVAEALRSKVSFFIELYRKNLKIQSQSRALVELKQRENERNLLELKQLWEAERLRETVRHERELAQASALFRILVSRIQDYAIFVTDIEGNIRTWNAAAERIFDYGEAEVIGRHFSIIFTLEDIASDGPDSELKRAREEGRAEDVRWHLKKDGTRFWADGVVTPLTDDKGSILGFAKILRDNTEKKKRDDKIRALTLELTRSNKELNQFAAVASHDLKEPLRTISSYLALLARRYEGKLDKDAHDYIGFAVSAAERMRQLIESILDYSGINRKGGMVEEIDCRKMIEELVQSLAAAIRESGAEMSFGLLPVIRGDRNQLTQVFQNLVSNAIKFRRAEAPRIRIWADRRGGEWLFSVSDNGIGIDMSQAEKIFEPFRRLHTQTDFAGSGIGLAVCKKIVELHGGRIWLESNEGEGATFHFTLPAHD